MAINSQGPRPNYQSSIQPLTYKKKSYSTRSHEIFIGAAAYDLQEVTERGFIPVTLGYCANPVVLLVDFEQPRALWQNVFNDEAREVCSFPPCALSLLFTPSYSIALREKCRWSFRRLQV